ncbi:hypothetical protein [Brevibacterium casei]|uniref:hypothetical protein n=1 Tax=Brevibacterium casei TaxID=33889 RepID=UPI00241FB3DB|nr:hypothetical protein [Brevibacterium casei]
MVDIDLGWDEKAEDHAVAHHTYEYLSPNENALYASGFTCGARWQRDQLRSDDAVERVAQFMWSERAKGTVHPHYPWTGLAPQLRDGLRQHARAAINALLGEEK